MKYILIALVLLTSVVSANDDEYIITDGVYSIYDTYPPVKYPRYFNEWSIYDQYDEDGNIVRTYK